MKQKKKTEFSKKLCKVATSIFLISVLVSIAAAQLGIGDSLIPYLLPSTGAVAAAALGFYFNKAKMENLSKQRLRTILIKLVLQEKLDEESFEELCLELDNIDETLKGKIEEMYSDSVYQDTTVEL